MLPLVSEHMAQEITSCIAARGKRVLTCNRYITAEETEGSYRELLPCRNGPKRIFKAGRSSDTPPHRV